MKGMHARVRDFEDLKILYVISEFLSFQIFKSSLFSYNETMDKIKIIFIGTSEIGVPLLEALKSDDSFDIKLVITQTDKPAGRKMQLTASPVKLKAVDLGIEVFQPDNINNKDSVDRIKKLKPDMIVLMAYGQILKPDILEIPQYGCINVHASILPKHRGASPIQQSLLHGDTETGISIIKMVEKMDAGPVYAVSKIPITDEDNAITLSNKLARLTAKRTPEVLSEIVFDGLKPVHQDHEKATYCQKIRKSDGNIDWKEQADIIAAKVRAFAGWPGTHTFWDGKRIKILFVTPLPYFGNEQPGTVSDYSGDIIVTCGKDALILNEVQMEGKKSQSISEFIKGYSDFVGSVVG